MLVKYKAFVLVAEGGYAAGILPDVPEVRVIQPQ